MIPRDGLIVEYLFPGQARDSSGRNHHGVVHGATPCADRFGAAGAAYQFDGVDDFIEVTPPPALNDRGLSVSVWAKYDARRLHGWTNCIVAQDNGNDADQSARVFQLSTDHQRIVDSLYWGRSKATESRFYRTRLPITGPSQDGKAVVCNNKGICRPDAPNACQVE